MNETKTQHRVKLALTAGMIAVAGFASVELVQIVLTAVSYR